MYHTLKNYQSQPQKESEPQCNQIKINKTFVSSFLEGFGIAIGNPKDILFFVAFFPQFIHITDSILTGLSILVAVWILLDFCILMSYALLMQKAILLRYKNLIGIISDIILMLVGTFGAHYLLQS